MDVAAIVVARGGSRRLPRKAMLPFGDSTLIGHKVDTLRRCHFVSRVVVGSDCPRILDEACRHGAETIQRDAFHCDEGRCSANQMLADMAGKVEGEFVLWAHPTNPLIKSDTYDMALKVFERNYFGNGGKHDSLVSVTRVQRHAWHRIPLHGGGMDVPFNFDPWAERHQPAAELSPLHFQDGAIFIQPRAAMMENRYFYGGRPILFEVDLVEGWDIDTQHDYDAARKLYGLT